MAKARKKARKAKRLSKKAKRSVKTKKTARRVSRRAKVRKRKGGVAGAAEAVLDSIRGPGSLRDRMAGRNTFED